MAAGSALGVKHWAISDRSNPDGTSRLAVLYPHFKGQEIEVELNGNAERDVPRDRLALALAETPPPYKARKVKTGKAGLR